MSSKLQLTPEQQKAAIDTLNENIALQSGAGCGKTFVLSTRFVNLLQNNFDQPDVLTKFVALTFTEKAALEMSQRVSKMLRARAEQTSDPEAKKILRNWLEQMPQARISTIHSFCSAILRSCAIDAELDPEFSVCSDTVFTRMLLEQAVENSILQNVEKDDQATCELLAIISFDKLKNLLCELIELRDRIDFSEYQNPPVTFARWVEISKAVRTDLLDNLLTQQTLKADFANLNINMQSCSNTSDKIFIAAKTTSDIFDDLSNQSYESFDSIFEKVSTINLRGGSAKNWQSKEQFTEVKALINSLKKELTGFEKFAIEPGDLDYQAAITLANLTNLAQTANEFFTEEKRKRSMLDFTDLMSLSSKLLAEKPQLAESIGQGITQLLVDEAQDTDQGQINFLESIMLANSETESLEDGAFFIVGDAKQSIYRFRGAQLSSFQSFCKKLGAQNQVNLKNSFRTHANGIEFVNHLFSELMGEDFSKTYSNKNVAPEQTAVEILLANGDFKQPGSRNATDQNFDNPDKAQAALTASRIEEMLQTKEQIVWDSKSKKHRATEPGDIAILFSRMTKSLAYERELQRRNIPYYVVSGSGFFNQQEIFDTLNLLRAINNPHDDIATVGVLKSPIFGLTDDSLMKIIKATGNPILPGATDFIFNSLTNILPADQYEVFASAWTLITKYSQEKDSYAIADLIETLLDETGYMSFLLTQDQGKRFAGNVMQLVSMARDSQGLLSLAEFIETMNHQTINQDRQEQAAAAGEDENVVRLMTIHKSKGLEFPIVFVPDLNAKQRSSAEQIFYRNDFKLVTKICTSDDESSEIKPANEPAFWKIAREFERLDETAEMIRKYYVAITRHEDHLVLVGANQRTADGSFAKGSFLEMIDQVLDLPDHDAEIKFGQQHEFAASFRLIKPNFAPQIKSRLDAPGRQILSQASSAKDVSNAIKSLSFGSKTPPLLGAINSEIGKVEVATTALNSFAKCPANFHWQYELRGPDLTRNKNSFKPEIDVEHPTGLSPMELGTVLHRCFELLDFRDNQSAQALSSAVIAESNFSHPVNADSISELLKKMLQKFNSTKLARDLANADEIHREIDFVTSFGSVTLNGQIDLLYRLGENWHIVDYKSDFVTPDSLTDKLKNYALQLGVYADAIYRHFGVLPKSTSLYFMRSGDLSWLEITAERLDKMRAYASSLAQDLITARRSGIFKSCGKPNCSYCRAMQISQP